MWIYFVAENFNFAISLLAGIAFLSAAWLYLDTGKSRETLPYILNFTLLGILSLIQSVFPNFVISLFVATITLLAALFYRHRAFVGLEKHLTPLFTIFLIYSLAEILAIHHLFINSNNPVLFPWVKLYGLFWFARLILILISTLLLTRWVFAYLLKRLQTQVFIFLNFFLATIFTVSTFSFSALIFSNLQTSILRQTTVETKMFANFLTSQQSQLNSDTQAFVQSPDITLALKTNDQASLATLSAQFLEVTHHSAVNFATAASGLVKNNHQLQLQASLNSVTITQNLDSTLLSRYTHNTDQNLLLYANNYILASSFQPESLIGLKTSVKNPSSITLLGQDYFASYLPLTDSDNLALGTLVAVLPVTDIVSLATSTLHTAFLIILGLELLFLLPAFFIAKYLESQFS